MSFAGMQLGTPCNFAALLLVAELIVGTSWAMGQAPVPPGTMGISTALPPAGRTKDTVRGVKALAQAGNRALEWFNDIRGTYQLQKRLGELNPQIQAKMPGSGGVLVAAYIDETRPGEGTVRTLRSVQIVGAYTSEKEAYAELALPKLKAAVPTLPFAGEPSAFVRTTPRYIWYPSPFRTPQLAKPEDLTAAHEKVSRLLGVARQTHEAENVRLEVEWEAIQKENSRLNKTRRLSKPVRLDATTTYADGKKEIEAWEADERRAIAADRAAATAENQAAADAQWRLEDYRDSFRGR